MEKQRSQAIESLEIYDHSVQCQKCGIAVPIVGKLIKPKSNRIAILEKRIRWIENYSRGNINRPSYINEVKQLKQELKSATFGRSLAVYLVNRFSNVFIIFFDTCYIIAIYVCDTHISMSSIKALLIYLFLWH